MLPVTPQPHEWLGVCVSIAAASCFSFVSIVVSGSPESRTRHNLVISKAWTTSPRLPCVPVGHLGVEPKPSCSQSRRAPICTSTRYLFASLRSSPCGSRTQPAWLERPVTSPEVERTVFQNESALAQALFRLGDGPRINANDSSRSAHARVKRFITFTPVVDVSIAQQQAVVQRVFWVRFEYPVGHSHLARPAFYSGK